MKENDHSSWWFWISIGGGMVYHWLILQGVSVATFVNLNFMLCANPGDPFKGPYYRVAGFFYFVSSQKFLENNFYNVILAWTILAPQ